MLRHIVFLVIVYNTVALNKFNVINKMKVFKLESNKEYENSVNFNIQPNMAAGLSSYYAGKDITFGTYRVMFEYDTVKGHKRSIIGHFKFSENEEQEIGKWITLTNFVFRDINDVNKILKFKITTERELTEEEYSESNNQIINSAAEIFSDTEFFKFIIYFKNPKEQKDGIREKPELFDRVDKEFCMDSVDTIGEFKTLGANCPIDPLTKKPMSTCLNWRRNDFVGTSCRKIVSQEDKDLSIIDFCGKNVNSEDCRCVNRGFKADYLRDKNKYSSHDYCWYQPCSSGNYLVLNRDKDVACNSQSCQVFYNVEKVTGDSNINNKSVQNCFSLKSENDKKKCLQNLNNSFPIVLLM